jgi:CRISPR type III-B/RAMP module-associated protein Cmr5
MAIQHLEQKRLIFAKSETEKEGRKKKPFKSPNYDSMVKKVPAYILNNGFLYTMAFLNEKDKEVFHDIWNWHCASVWNEQKLMPKVEKNNFLDIIFRKDDTTVRALTMETLALMRCMRRFVNDED